MALRPPPRPGPWPAALRSLPGLALLALAGAIWPATARDPGPESGPQVDAIERARAEGPRLAAECRELTEEVDALHALSREYELLKTVGESSMRRITLPGSGVLMHDRIQALKRDIRERETANPHDPAINRLRTEHNTLHDDYVARMNGYIAEWEGLPRGVRDYATLLDRYSKVRVEWEPRQSRHAQAREEKARVCEQARRAEELMAAGACDRFNLGAGSATPRRQAADRRDIGGNLDLLAGLLGIRAAHAIGTAPGEIAAYVHGEIGLVCVKPRRAGTWARLRTGQPVEVGDTVRTGPDGRARLEFTDRDEEANAGPSVMNLAPDTELEIIRFVVDLRALEREQRRREGLVSLIRGEIRAFMKGWGSSSSVNVRAGVAICGSRGTDFVVTHAPREGRVTLKVGDGKVAFSTPRGSTLVAAGQMASATGPALGPIQAMPADIWNRSLAAIEIPATDAATPVAAIDLVWGCEGRFRTCRPVWFAGGRYETVYRPGTNAEGSPVDEYFYPLLIGGETVYQDGKPLWNSFARVRDGYPRAGYWHIEWRREGDRWVEGWRQVSGVVPLDTAPHVQATPMPGERSPPATPPSGPALPGQPFPPVP